MDRGNSGELAVQGHQIQEQVDRTTLFQSPADLSVTGNATTEPLNRASRSIVFNPPSGGRIAQVETYVDHDNANYGSVVVFAYLSFNGEIVSKLKWRLKSDTAEDFPFPYPPHEGYGMAYVTLPESGPAVFTLTIVRGGFTTSTTTETLTNIRMYVTPAQKTM